MASIIERLTRHVPQNSPIYQLILLPLRFSFRYMLLTVIYQLLYKFRLEPLANVAAKARDRWIQNYLTQLLAPVLEKYQDDTALGQPEEHAPIWVFWWTGVEDAPDLIRHCINNIQRHSGNHPVHVLSRDNYAQYVQLPNHLLEKLHDGKIGLAHFSDCIRTKLLAQYGGLWLDATIFVSGPIPEEYFSYPLFTSKGPVRESEYVSNYRWTSFCLGGWKGNVFYRYLTDAFDLYWQTCDRAVTYLFFDYIIKVAYDQIPIIRQLLDELPDNNIHRDDLHQALISAQPAETLDAIWQEDTCLYKLNWKTKYPLTTPDGNPSSYARLLGPHEQKQQNNIVPDSF